MEHKGVIYDVDLRLSGETLSSADPSNLALLRKDIMAIAHGMAASAIRIEAEEIDRLVSASRIAHEHGLCVFFTPRNKPAPANTTRAYFRKAARAAEVLRKEGIDIVFVCANEISLTLPVRTSENDELKKNSTQPTLYRAIRDGYAGPVTYSSGPWVDQDWSVF